MIRPVRLGIVFEPALQVLRSTAVQATSVWGGCYQLMLDPARLDQLPAIASGLGIDVLWAMDVAALSRQAAELAGYRWRGLGEFGPLAPSKEYNFARLVGPEGILAAAEGNEWTLPRWMEDDPLDAMFSAWFGTYGADDYGVALEQQFSTRAETVTVELGDNLPDDASFWITPIAVTGLNIEYVGLSPGAGFIVVDPDSPLDLMTFWNLRACGAAVYPWPSGHEQRVAAAATEWLRRLRDNDQLSNWRSGDGRQLGPRIQIWLGENRNATPGALLALLAEAGVDPMPTPHGISRGWRGDHPLTTEFSSRFSQPLADGGHAVDVPVPRLGEFGGLREWWRSGIVALQVEIDGATGVSPDWTFSVPNVPAIAPFLADRHPVMSQFHRATPYGRALAVHASDQTAVVAAVPSLALVNQLIESPGWNGRRTEGGVFVSRLIERLGGPGSTIGNQPGARAGLLQAAKSIDGRPSGAIVQSIRQSQGSWPDPFASAEIRAAYSTQVFRYLLSRSILRPVLPVVCPSCTTRTVVRPEDLSTQLKCEMCLEEFPLGLALGMSTSGHNDWLYRVAGHVSAGRLSEALPVMAALQVLTSIRFRSPSTVPHVLGWKVDGPGVDCEVDIAAILEDAGRPVVVVGEVKNYRDSITIDDLRNLSLIQQHLRERNIECFILTAVLRELRQEETDALRYFAHRTFDSISTRPRIEAVLPIVLTEQNLSISQWERHPSRWAPADGVVGLAKESCRQNLGLTDLKLDRDNHGYYFRPTWS